MKVERVSEVLSDLNFIISKVEAEEIDDFKKLIHKAKRIFFAGRGRSLLIAKAIAMRFMQYGFEVYPVGETNTPSFEEEDLLIAVSGSGETETTVLNVKKAKKIGGTTAVLTADRNSTLAEICDQIIEIPVNKMNPKNREQKLVPGGSYFEEAVLIFGDTLIVNLAEEKDIKMNQLFKRHANLE